MKIGVLTSSRADFGIYIPLLLKLRDEECFNVEIIAFGAHMHSRYGNTLREIESYNFPILHTLNTPVENTEPKDISHSIGSTIISFSSFWSLNRFDLILALGDRYEMFAAIAAATPFNFKIAHLHAGETTLGAIDNGYRHSISTFASILFVSTERYAFRAKEIVGNDVSIYCVGALSIDNLVNQALYTIEQFYELFCIDLSKPSILCTFHPETVALNQNKEYIKELVAALTVLQVDFQIIITMPNSDTMGNVIREIFLQYANKNDQVIVVESFGMLGYLSCMSHAYALIGNTSSGFVEAAFFPKWVINLGNRQDGRIRTPNIIDVKLVQKNEILKAFKSISNRIVQENCNVYGNGNTADLIISNLKNYYGLE